MTARQLGFDNAYLCAECDCYVDRDDNPPIAREIHWDVPGVGHGAAIVPVCPACANRDEFTIGQRVRFRACPSLVGVVTGRTRSDDGAWLYTVRGSVDNAILGPPYRREHLEECK